MLEITERPNVKRFKDLYEAFSKGDVDTIREALADYLVWHVPDQAICASDLAEGSQIR